MIPYPEHQLMPFYGAAYTYCQRKQIDPHGFDINPQYLNWMMVASQMIDQHLMLEVMREHGLLSL